jgi:hypothetical protein
MSIRSGALQWFKSKYKNDNSKVYTSKYYLPEESWPKTHVWWLQIPLKALNTLNGNYINLICQAAPNSSDYHYLKVPVKYFREQIDKFDIVQDKMIHIYLSADTNKLFLEERGTGKLDFSKFLVN